MNHDRAGMESKRGEKGEKRDLGKKGKG